ncbi:hypothetical protein [Prevotella sp. 10(H)]|uniref:hypothetical protein n=1 Tax=Prevotella sp. 10(H) TaxID=1158294 RepID=UPI00055BBA23|nr:hypothetical protein [Prevotella sp. 10(H)]
MKKFLTDIMRFAVLILIAGVIIIFLPATPRSKESLLFSGVQKDSMMQYTSSPRFIMIGGSNIGMGINSQMIKDSLQMNPINTGINAIIGLKFMLDRNQRYIKAGDVVVVIPEYSQFMGDFAYGNEDLLRMIFDVSLSDIKLLDSRQWDRIIDDIPNYIRTKLRISSYKYPPGSISPIYSNKAYNQYGDAAAHWYEDVEKEREIILHPFDQEINLQIVDYILEFAKIVEAKGAKVYVSYPGLNESSYNVEWTTKLDSIFRSKKLKVLGTPEEFIFPDSLIYDYPYHFVKEGVDLRTNELIEEYKKSIAE